MSTLKLNDMTASEMRKFLLTDEYTKEMAAISELMFSGNIGRMSWGQASLMDFLDREFPAELNFHKLIVRDNRHTWNYRLDQINNEIDAHNLGVAA
jgi:hypothetical protein